MDAMPAAARDRLLDLMRGCSVEVSARDPLAGEPLREIIRPGAAVYINYAPGDTHHGAVAAATRLRKAGFDPVPHVVARYLASFSQLNDYLVRGVGEAGIRRVLVIAGDAERPVGPYQTSLQLLETGLFERHGIRQVDVAGYPEGHPRVSAPALDEALAAKLALAKRTGLALSVVTQFGFEAAPIVAWLRHVRALGIDVPVRVGLAGPASISTLAKFAMRCGVGNSLRALFSGHSSVTRLLTEAGPEPVMRALLAENGDLGIAGLHFFTFGGVKRTGAWIEEIVQGKRGVGLDDRS
ncbi:MAG TPA: methylenetetrahydrofolate reductase [Stellaceae bacterium]|nr:methylenetetrahydrofolate reductase [Stellaceae bacterium]